MSGGCSEQSKCTLYVMFMLLVNSVAIAMVVIGAINTGEGRLNGCPSEPFVPWFLIIGGSIIMCGLFVREILKRFCECCNDCCDEKKWCRIGGKILKFSTTVLFDIAFLGVSAVWLIAGTVNLIHLYDDIVGQEISGALSGIRSQTDSVLDTVLEPTDIRIRTQQRLLDVRSDECSPLLYNFTFAVLVAAWILIAISAIFLLFFRVLYNVLCCRPCRDNTRGYVYA